MAMFGYMTDLDTVEVQTTEEIIAEGTHREHSYTVLSGCITSWEGLLRRYTQRTFIYSVVWLYNKLGRSSQKVHTENIHIQCCLAV